MKLAFAFVAAMFATQVFAQAAKPPVPASAPAAPVAASAAAKASAPAKVTTATKIEKKVGELKK